jgi:hypothetical protein
MAEKEDEKSEIMLDNFSGAEEECSPSRTTRPVSCALLGSHASSAAETTRGSSWVAIVRSEAFLRVEKRGSIIGGKGQEEGTHV